MSTFTPRQVATAFGGLLRTARLGAGLSQKKLADSAGMSLNAEARYERGQLQPTLSKIIDLAAALGIEPHTLVQMTVSRLRSAVQITQETQP